MIRAGGAPIPGRSLLDIPPGGALGDILADTNGDPSSTNIYLGNISPKLSEQTLTQLFGRFGPLASIKIMYPRTDEERSRGKNCGFVAYMSRSDGERAMASLLGKTIEGHEMRMGWGKPVPLPLQPVYVPPALQRYIMPPPPSGLPFNCQPDKKDADTWGFNATNNPRPCEVPQDSRGKRQFDRMLSRARIKVVIPLDRTQLCLINRMIEFVIREGPIFEATIMNRELTNPQFRFLFENQSPEHVYYRWRMFSLLQGDNKDQWSTKEFRMFKGGSLWRPPVPNVFTAGVPAELLDADGACIDPVDDDEEADRRSEQRRRHSHKPASYEPPPAKKPVAPILPGKKPLSDSQRDTLESTLRSLLPERSVIICSYFVHLTSYLTLDRE
jgi:U2-associated protein SR140